jgi:septal ring-binding cell division protein DamX
MEHKVILTTLAFMLSVTLIAVSATVEASPRVFSIQISSELSAGKAKALITILKHQGIDAFEVPAHVKGVKRFRVFAGTFETAARAKEARIHFSKLAHRKDVFVQTLKTSALPNSVLFPAEGNTLSEW